MAKLTKERKNELLIDVLERLKKSQYHRGICYFIDCLNLVNPHNEVMEFYKWFQSEKPRPKKNYQFTKNNTFYNGMWWWVLTDEGKQSRIEFLEYLIEKTK